MDVRPAHALPTTPAAAAQSVLMAGARFVQVNGNGLLDLEEVGELAALMQGGKPLSKTQLQAAMRDMDKDNSGGPHIILARARLAVL